MTIDSSMRAGLGALVLMGMSACGPRYEALHVQRVNGHLDARGSEAGFSVPEGTLLVFEVDPRSHRGREYDATDEVELEVEHPEVARIVQGLATDTWMLLGVGVGQTVVEVSINGEVHDHLPVDIVAQEEL